MPMFIQPAALLGIGFNEFMLLTILALVIIGPQRLPEVARGIGKLMAQFRRATSDLRDAVNTEINSSPELRDLKQIREDIGRDMRGLGQRARNYMDREFDKEQEALGSVERDMHGVANDIGGAIREGERDARSAAEDADISGVPAEDGGATPGAEGGRAQADPPEHEPVEPTPGREPWNVQMNKLFFRDKIEAGEMAADGKPPPADSPEDDYVAEREAAADSEPAAPAPEPEAETPAADEPSSGKPA